ncbi:malonyl-CoA decarboxylase [Telmatospirillum siberiense]|uniref:Malonyl-CoA decarboxylase n=1 Tax=Telmatospirillum siberiense TaxID=382514 RepID=A0A2N3PZM4_9PROT|nr:malonyl-CoA decarboxylase [Telmatospirillum siberiense]PKU25856.1 malonyl-CoA decarboxylase [Telmatospirillum siberiense]
MDDGKLAGLVTQAANYGLFDRLKTLRGLWRDIAQSLGGAPKIDPELPADDAALLRNQVRECLQGRGGEVSARARAATLGRSYLELNAVGRRNFLKMVADEFGPDTGQVDKAMADVAKASGPAERHAAERSLREALESPRQRLLTQFNALPEGVKFLVDMRAELLPLSKGDPAMQAFEADLKELLSAWFDVGFLELQRITWRSPALILEKIMAYEAVHAIQGWSDLKNRLDSDRRLYAFFHPRMPDEPLIFVEVALVRGIAGNIHDLLDEHAPVEDPKKADTAIFYSINNAQKGLVGISFGNFLIKRVVDSLLHEFPNLKTFSTLSPIPGFRTWLNRRLAEGEDAILEPAELRALAALPAKGEGAPQGFAQLLDSRWVDDGATAQALRTPLIRLCAHYLLEKRSGTSRALDPVAHFHLTNGARMERLNWLADTSDKGVAQSAGMMINYLYKLSEIEANHEAYRGQGKIVTSAAVRALGKG